ncbi:MAG: sodium:solute symporter family protein [Clostridiales Family XIII bacterium]|jgi:SSS family solute:Na+ symporter|nr:sodium:solute symporter family protein [Clostridiales Family XIII bacterium]
MVQIIIIVIYFALTVAIGMMSSRKSKSSAAFHGAAMGVTAIVCASAGEWLGGTSTTGVSEYGFMYGLSGSWYTIANGIGVMFLALCFAKLYRSLDSVTVPGIIENFFGVKARTVSSVLLTVVMLAVGLSQMIAAGKLGQSLLGFDFNLTVVGFAVIFIVYTLAGGMNAVASTNQMHLFVMYGGVLLAIVFALMKVNGWGAFTEGIAAVAAAEGKASYFNMLSIGMPKVSSWIIASLLGACTAQAGIQPVLAAKDVPTAKKACIITAFVAAPFGIFTALLGMIAKVMSGNGSLLDTAGMNVTDAKLALPTLMMNLPPVVGGLVLASILAAILSTVSPIILAAGTMITKDLYHRVLKPAATDAQVLFMSRLTTALSGVICSAAAIALVNMTAVLDIVYSAYSLRGALFIVVLFGIYWKRASEKAACQSMVLTGIVAVAWVAVKLATGHYPIADALTETYAAVVVAALATLILSLIFPRRISENTDLEGKAQ